MTGIKRQRQALGMTQTELARCVGVTQGAVMQWEGNLTNPKTELLPAIAKALNCRIEDLFDDAISAEPA